MPSKWELKSALIGFTRLNNAHNGERLGQALFKIIKRVSITGKVCIFYMDNVLPCMINCEGWPCHL